MKIFYQSANETVVYAAEELKKYVGMMCPTADVTIMEGDSEDGIKLGLLEDFGLSTEGVEDVLLDDIYEINVENGKGFIAGSNPRSVLFGVYTFLKSCGCMWLRPGKDGEYIPEYDVLKHSFCQRKKASSKFRCQMSEGALKYEYLMDFITWMPKVGYNMFFMQFVYPYAFFLRWYRHLDNTARLPEDITYEQIEEYVHRAESLIKRCGILLLSMGHGYLFEPYGVRNYGPTAATGIKYEIPEKYKKYAAQVNGKRDVYNNSINYTQLCFSNPQARKDCVDYLVSFAKERKPELIHVSLADAAGNWCECDECRKKMPSDWYVMLINEIDEAFARNGLDIRICFSLYVNTLWAPKYEKLNHPENLMVSIGLSRSFHNPLPKERKKVEIPAFELNASNVPSGADVSLAFLEQWKDIYAGAFVTTAYDSYAIHYSDPGLQLLAKRTSEDIKTLSETEGFSGIRSCQTQRIGFPTALPVALMGEMLVDPGIVYEEYTEKFFRAAFGDDYKKAVDYLETITKLFNPARLAICGSIVNLDTGTGKAEYNPATYIGNPEAQADFREIASVVDGFAAVVANNLNLDNACHKKSWELFSYHGTYCKKLAAFYLAVSELDKEKTDAAYNDLIDWLSKTEEIIGQFFDFYIFKVRKLDVVMRQIYRNLKN